MRSKANENLIFGQSRNGGAMAMKLKVLFFSAFVLLGCGFANAATYYIDPGSGSDSNSGTSSAPWQSMNKAQNSARAGDTVILQDGYYGSITYSGSDARGSSWASPVTYKAAEGATPDFDKLFFASGASDLYVVFDGITVYPSGVYMDHIVSGVKLQNMKIAGKWSSYGPSLTDNGIIMEGTFGTTDFHEIYIDNCEITDVHTGVKLEGALGKNVVISNNEIHHIAGSGIKISADKGNEVLRIEGNHIYNQDPVDEGSSGITHGTGISIRNDNMIVRGNIIRNFGNTRGIRTYQDIFPTRGYRNMVFENNLLYDVRNVYVVEFVDMGDDFVFNNNTVIGSEFGRSGNKWYETALRVVWPSGVDGSRLEMRNNIFVGLVAIGGQVYNADFRNNVMYALNSGETSFGDNYVANGTSGHSTYFEGSGNYFVGGELFDKYSYTRPGGHPHGVDLGDSYYVVDRSRGAGYEFGRSGPAFVEIANKTVAENETLTFDVTATHPDGAALTYTAENMPEGATFSGQTFSWTPVFSQAGDYTVTFTATDGTMSASVDVKITVTPVDDDADGMADYWEIQHFGDLSADPTGNPDGDQFNNLQEYEEGLDPHVFDEGPLNLILDAQFNDDPADGVEDSSRYHNDGVALETSIPNLVTSETYAAYDFDGVDDFITFGTDASLNTTDSLTVTGWIYPRTYGQSGYGRIVDKGDGTTGYSVFVNQQTRALSYVVYGSNVVSSEAGSMTLDQWHHFAVVYDKSASAVTFYIDGVQRGSASYGTSPGDSAISPLVIGTRGYDLARCFDGAMDEIRIYNEALPEAEVLELASPSTNRAPVLQAIGDQSVTENELLAFGVTATDPDGDNVATTATNLPTGAEFANDTFSWTPAEGQAGSYDVSFYATDGELQDSETINITVLAANRAPVLEDTPDQTVNVGSSLEFAISATDPDGDTISYTAQNLPTGADFTGNTFSWTPVSGQAGTYLTSFVASDGELEDVDTVTITVVEESGGGTSNTAPQFTPVSDQTATVGQLLEFLVSATDADGDLLSITADSLPAGAQFLKNRFAWTPSSDQVGEHNATFTVTDGTASDTMTVRISVSAPVLTAEPVGQWKLNEASGNTATDSSTEDNDGELAGAVWTAGVDGSAVEFDGVDDCVVVSDASSLNLTGSLTVAAWVRPDGFGSGGFGRILDKGASAAGYSFFVNHKFGGLSFATYGGPVADSSSNVITAGKWQHVAAVYDQAASVVTFYVDGVNVGTASYTGAPADSSGSPLTIGIRGQDMGRAFDGAIDEVSLYNYALAQSEIDALAVMIPTEPVNTAPQISPIADQTVEAGQTLRFTIEASDADGDLLTYSSSNLPDGSTLNGNVFNWTPLSSQTGVYNVDIVVSDGQTEVSETVTITVAEKTVGSATGHWRLDDASGTIAADSSAKNNDGTLTNGAVWTAGINGSAVAFDGVDDYILVDDASSLNLTGSISVAAWIKPDTFGSRGYGRILDKGASASGYSFFVNAKFGGLSFATYGGPVADSMDNIVTPGKWQHVAMVYDQAAAKVTFYLDGVYAGAADYSKPPSDSAGSPLTIGIRGQDMGRAFDGAIDEVHLYDYAITQSDIDLLAKTVSTDPANTAPQISAIADQMVQTGQTLQFAIEASDADGDALTYASPNLPAGAALNDNVFTWTPDSTGIYDVEFVVSDGTAQVSEVATITVIDNAAGDAVGYWNLDDASGDIANDLSAYNNNGVLGNGAAWATGISGTAVEFDGVDDFIVAKDSPSLNMTGSYTVSAWIKPNSFGSGGFGRILDKGASSSGYSFFINHKFGGLSLATYGGPVADSNKDVITVGKWQHVAAVYDQAASSVTFYVDGVNAGTVNYKHAPADSTGSPLTIGIRGQDMARAFDGAIDDVRLYDYAVTQSDVERLTAQN